LFNDIELNADAVQNRLSHYTSYCGVILTLIG